MVLTERDKQLLKTLQSYAMLTTSQVGEKVFPGIAITTVLRRLRALEGDGYIQRIDGLPSTERAWGVSGRAVGIYLEEPAKVHFSRHSLDHDLKLTDLRLRLEGQGIALSWIPEHVIRTKIARAHGLRALKQLIVPDAIVGVESKGVKESISIELELNFKNSRRYQQIFRDYREKKNLLAIWYVVASKPIGRHLSKCYRDCFFDIRQPYLFWSLLEDVMRDPAQARLWYEAREYRVEDFFALKPVPGAQLPAQGVSTLEGAEWSAQSESTVENDSEIPEASE